MTDKLNKYELNYVNKKLILNSIIDLANECRSHSECKYCVFYDETDSDNMCIIKNADNIPADWYIG